LREAESTLLPAEVLGATFGISGTRDNTIETAEAMISGRVVGTESLSLAINRVEHSHSSTFSSSYSGSLSWRIGHLREAESTLLPAEVLGATFGISGTRDNTIETAEAMISGRVVGTESLSLAINRVEHSQSSGFGRRLSGGLGWGVLEITDTGAR